MNGTTNANNAAANGGPNGTQQRPSLTRVPSTTPAQEVLAILRREGGLVVEKLADPKTLDTVWEEIKPHLHSQKHVGVTFAEESRRITGLVGKRGLLATTNEGDVNLLGLRENDIKEPPQLTNSMAFWLGPGSKAQGLHRDDQCHHTRHPAKYETDLGIMFAGTRSHKANGATNVVPYSHLWDDERKPKLEEAASAELEKGDALIWLGSTYHGAGHNSTKDEYRLLLAAFTTPGWCRQDENQYLTIPHEVIESYPKNVAMLLGYYVSRPYGGFVEQMEPLDFLKARGDWTKYIPSDLI